MARKKYGEWTTKHYYSWTLEDIRLCMRDNMKLNDIAIELGRTTAAVIDIRMRVRKGKLKI